MSAEYQILNFLADTVDGKILEFPKKFYLRCGMIQQLGVQVVRNYTGTECIEAITVFLIYYNGQVLGSKCWNSKRDFMRYYQAVCQGDGLKNVCIDNRPLQINGCWIKI